MTCPQSYLDDEVCDLDVHEDPAHEYAAARDLDTVHDVARGLGEEALQVRDPLQTATSREHAPAEILLFRSFWIVDTKFGGYLQAAN